VAAHAIDSVFEVVDYVSPLLRSLRQEEEDVNMFIRKYEDRETHKKEPV
jgi:hypothetical protein